MFKRVVIKLSGEYLAGELSESGERAGAHFDEAVSGRIAGEILSVRGRGAEIGLVIGGGNFWRGAEAPAAMDRVSADKMGMLASVMNAVYLSDAFRRGGANARVLTPFAMGGFTENFNRDLADAYLVNGDILIFAGGTGHPFFSTDTIAAIRGAELNADCVLFAKGVEGVCDADPKKLPVGATYGVYREISCRKMIRDGLGVVDMAAAQLLMQQKVYSVLFDIRREGGIPLACESNDEILKIGTKIYHNKDREWEDDLCRNKQIFTKTK